MSAVSILVTVSAFAELLRFSASQHVFILFPLFSVFQPLSALRHRRKRLTAHRNLTPNIRMDRLISNGRLRRGSSARTALRSIFTNKVNHPASARMWGLNFSA